MVSRQAIAWRRLTLSISGALIVATCASASPPPASETPPGSNGGLVLLDGPSMHDSDQLLYLEVVLNQVPTNYILQVAQRDGTLYVLPEHLTTLGLLMGELASGEHQALETLPELQHRYDASQQRLYLEAAPHRLDLGLQAYRAARDATPRAEASPGILLNYDMHVSADEHGGRDVTAATGLRAFAGNQVLENTALSRASNRGDRGDHTRLDTHWTWSSQEDLLTVTAGDLISGGLPWTRATRLGGLQIRRNFGLQPDLVTQPLPAFFGEAALPSAVELYVEGQRQYSGEVLPGDYRIDSHPAVTGLGQAEVVLTDALGRTTVHDFSFYSSPRLLQQGLSDFSLEVGSVRRGYGTDSFRYRGHPAGLASLRYGLTDALTLEGHAEADERLAVGGLGTLFTLRQAGLISAAWAQSAGSEADGGQLALGYSWAGHGFTVDYSLQRSYEEYRDIASSESRPPPRRSERLSLGVGSSTTGRLSLNYNRLERLAEQEGFRSVGAGYSRRIFPGANLYLNASRELNDERGYSLHAGLSLSLGGGVSGGTSASRTRDGGHRQTAYLRRGVPGDGGTGWGLQAQRSDGREYFQADVVHRGDSAQLGGGIRSMPGSNTLYGDLAGSLVWMAASPRDLFPARRVSDGFALVSTNGIAGVPVELENRHIGDTNQRGHYLLTGLGAYRSNRVSIDPLQLPADVQMDAHQTVVVPAERAGVRVDFGLRRVRAALLTLTDSTGRPLPLGSHILRDGNRLGVVGHDGQAYVEALQAQNRVVVRRPDGTDCRIEFVLPDELDTVPAIGPLACRE